MSNHSRYNQAPAKAAMMSAGRDATLAGRTATGGTNPNELQVASMQLLISHQENPAIIAVLGPGP